MKIRKIFISFLVVITAALFLPVNLSAQNSGSRSSDSLINDGDHGLHLRGSLGVGKILWSYISYGSGSGDLGTGVGGTINLAAMYNYSFLGLEFNMLSGNIGDLEWTDKDDFGVEHTYKSTGTGYYSVFDFKLGAKLFTERGDMGYTYLYIAKRFWNSERTHETKSLDGSSVPIKETRNAKGDGWIYGYRDFSTFGMDDSIAIVFQSGLFLGKAPVSKMTKNGEDESYPVKESLTIGGELGAGVAFQNIGLSVIGGLRGEINVTTLKDPATPPDEDSIFGFGNYQFFVEAGMMF